MLTKSELRKALRVKRKLIDNKTDKDNSIFSKLISLECFKRAETILCYLSLDEEIFTDNIIEYALSEGKRIAVPYCRNNKGNMDFYLIDSLDNLNIGMFGVREPDVNISKRLSDFRNSIIIVPAISYDRNGFRIGYGKGYYDRFIKKYPFISIGLCYNSLIQNELPKDNYDEAVDIIITENSIINNGGENG